MIIQGIACVSAMLVWAGISPVVTGLAFTALTVTVPVLVYRAARSIRHRRVSWRSAAGTVASLTCIACMFVLSLAGTFASAFAGACGLAAGLAVLASLAAERIVREEVRSR